MELELAEIVKSGVLTAVTVTAMEVVCESDPLAPVIATK